MNNFQFLNLNIPLFREGITVNDLPKNHIAVIDKDKLINEKIFHFFESLNLKISFVETFYKTPEASGSIHTDSVGGDYVKLNWIFGAGDSEMCWYRPKAGLEKKPLFTDTNTRYLSYSQDEVEEITRIKLKNPTLVQVGIPHNIVNVTEDRYCVSIIFENGKRPSMQESIEIFKDYIIGSE